jgi:hypothetical protein
MTATIAAPRNVAEVEILRRIAEVTDEFEGCLAAVEHAAPEAVPQLRTAIEEARIALAAAEDPRCAGGRHARRSEPRQW